MRNIKQLRDLGGIAVLLLALPFTALADDDWNDIDDLSYFVSMGTSLAAGVQADAVGQSILTENGYADQLYDILRADNPGLVHIRLGCPAESTASMITGVGSRCTYPRGSQLAEALAAIRKYDDDVVAISIDVGVNDILDCLDLGAVDLVCLADAFDEIENNLPVILALLSWAKDDDTPIVGMNYYNTGLAAWFLGPAGQDFARQSAALGIGFNEVLLGGIYDTFGIPVADVATAFRINEFEPLVPFPTPDSPFTVPLNVATLCALTFMCPAPGSGAVPNIHANDEGYGVIAATFAVILEDLIEDDDDGDDDDSSDDDDDSDDD